MRFLVTDFKRALTERTFIVAVCIGLVCVLASLGIYCYGQTTYIGTEAFLQSQSLILPFIAPILATLPYANMLMLEEDCGYKRFLLSKNKMKTYRLSRWLVTGVAGGLAVAIPLAILAVICGMLGAYNNIQYIGGIVLLDFCFGFSYASIAYGLGFVNQKRYIPTVAPQVIYLLFIYAFPYLGLEQYYPPLSFSPWLLEGYGSLQNSIIQFAVLNGLALLLIMGHWGWETLKQMNRWV